MHASIWKIRALQNSQLFQNSKLNSLIRWGIWRYWNNTSGHESPGHENVLPAYVLLTNVLAFIKDSGIIGTGPSDHYLAYFVFNTKLMCPKAIPLKLRPESLPSQHSAFLGCVHFWQLWCLLMLGTTLKSSSRWPGASIMWEYDQLKKKYSKSRIKSRGLGKVPIVQE